MTMPAYLSYPAPPDFHSDGCTVPFPLKPLYRCYTEACRWHDWARKHLVHHKVITVRQADWQFRAYLRDLGAPAWLCSITWVVVKLARKKYSRTLPVPTQWVQYIEPKA